MKCGDEFQSGYGMMIIEKNIQMIMYIKIDIMIICVHNQNGVDVVNNIETF